MPRPEIVRAYNVDGILDSLTDFQRRFALAYLETDNGSEAVRRAGSKATAPGVLANKLLKNEKVARAIGELKRRIVENELLSVEKTLEQLQHLVSRGKADLIDPKTGETLPLHKMTDRGFACVDGWNQVVRELPDGTKVIKTKVKLVPHAQAVDMAMRKFGEYAPQKVEAAVAHVDWEQMWKDAAQAENEDADSRLKRLEAELVDDEANGNGTANVG